MTFSETIGRRVERLPSRRRQEVLEFIAFIESREAGDDMGAAWDTELGRRIGDIEAGRTEGRPVADVVREMRAKYG